MARPKPARTTKPRTTTPAPSAPKTRATTTTTARPKTRTVTTTSRPKTRAGSATAAPKTRGSATTAPLPKSAIPATPTAPKKRRAPVTKPRRGRTAAPTAGEPPPMPIRPTQSVTIGNVNGQPFNPMTNYPRNQALVVEGAATVSFQFLTGRVDPPSAGVSVPNSSSGASAAGWQLTWNANTIATAGQSMLTVSVVGGSASDAIPINFA